MIKILLAEDHVLVRQGLKMFLATEPDFEVIAETGDGARVESMVQSLQPDLLLLDLDLPGCHGTHITTRLKAQASSLKIVVLTGSLQPDSVRQALAAGADAYVLKHEDSTEFLHAIHIVLGGGQYISSSIAALFEHEQSFHQSNEQSITPREQEILAMIARGMNNEAIATQLYRSVLTIRKHRQNLMDKLGLHNADEITAYAIKHGFYEPV